MDCGYTNWAAVRVFVPISGHAQNIVATREFFPQTMRSAIRQRTRWITGIALQSWERHGWRGNWAQVYWFWPIAKDCSGIR